MYINTDLNFTEEQNKIINITFGGGVMIYIPVF